MPEIAPHHHIVIAGVGPLSAKTCPLQPLNYLGSNIANSFHVDAPCSDGSTVKQVIHHEMEVFPPKFGGSDEHGG